jgi:hypothetical protein
MVVIQHFTQLHQMVVVEVLAITELHLKVAVLVVEVLTTIKHLDLARQVKVTQVVLAPLALAAAAAVLAELAATQLLVLLETVVPGLALALLAPLLHAQAVVAVALMISTVQLPLVLQLPEAVLAEFSQTDLMELQIQAAEAADPMAIVPQLAAVAVPVSSLFATLQLNNLTKLWHTLQKL